MDPLSRDLEKAELETSRPSHSSHHHQQEAASAPRSASLSSSNSSSAASSSPQSQFRYDDDYISRIQTAQTQRSAVLERHATAISHIATQRSQHSATVGALKSRPSRKPLPEFGAGKPYPPLLPSREEYVVEFSGPDHPMHPQNWSTIKNAASALAANSILRSVAGAGFTLFATYMFNGIGVDWTGTLLGCVAAVLMPIPLLFYLYGHKIQAKSTFSANYLAAVQAHNDE